VPAWTGTVLTPAGDLRADWTSTQHITNNFTIRLRNVQSITDASIIIVLGQYPTNNISFNVTASQIAFSGPSASSFSKSWTNGVLVLENTSAVSTLDLTIDIPIPADTSFGTETFPILTQSSKGQGNGNIAVTVYENQPPVVERLEIEPLWSANNVTVRLGDSFRVRATANDTGRGGSQICGCWIQLNNSAPTFSTSCTMQYALSAEGNWNITAWATDSANNTGAAISQAISLNLLPRQLYFNNLNKLWSKQDLDELKVAAAFQTADSDSWNNKCTVHIADSSGEIWNKEFSNTGSGTTANCNAEIKVPKNIPPSDGIYYVTISATDNDGSTITSQRRIFYMCDRLTSSGPGWSCAKADFDNDSATDGVLIDLWAPGYTQHCDNCPKLWNNQSDIDMDGVGDICDNCPTIYNPDQDPDACKAVVGPAGPAVGPPSGGEIGVPIAITPITIPRVVPRPPGLPSVWPPVLIQPACRMLSLPATGVTVKLAGELRQSTPLPGAVGLLLYPIITEVAQICNIKALDPYAYGTLPCGFRSLASYGYFVSADSSYFCMRHQGVEQFDQATIQIMRFDGNWIEIPPSRIMRDKDLGIICANITGEPEGMLAVAGKYMGVQYATKEETSVSIKYANDLYNVLRNINLRISKIEELLKTAQNANTSCDWDAAKKAADAALWLSLVAIAGVVFAAAVVSNMIYTALRKFIRMRKISRLSLRKQ
jgi:hypothetical protein